MLRCLLGPVAPTFATNLLKPTADRVFFDTAGQLDRSFSPGFSWKEFTRQFPAGWEPDVLLLWLPYASIPSEIWKAPIPIIGRALFQAVPEVQVSTDAPSVFLVRLPADSYV